MYIDSALDLAYSYAAKKCNEEDLQIVATELRKISDKKDDYAFNDRSIDYSYSEIQNMLSKLNEKESIRKSKGVYYTPCDVVRFIVANSIKASYGKLSPDNISQEGLEGIPYNSLATKKTVFDPTCGSGEYLLVALEMKVAALKLHNKTISVPMAHKMVSTIYGNDINNESIVISKIRLLLCIMRKVGVKAVKGISRVLEPNFYTYDYIVENVKNVKYDIIVGNPPYVEDYKSGLSLKKKYGNIYANVLINASKQLSTGGSIGFIIPLSYISTPRMVDLRNELMASVSEQYIMSYADRPDCLFDSVHQKLCILVGKQRKSGKRLYTGNYQYWYKDERDELFKNTHVVRNTFATDDFIPKLGTSTDVDIYCKITNEKKYPTVYEVSRNGTESVFLNRREAFWMKAYRENIDNPEYKVFSFDDDKKADYCYCLINSSLFWWYWIGTSDCWHVSKCLNGFRAPFNCKYDRASKLANDLRKRLEETKVYVGTKQTDYEYKHRDCIKEIHAIDDYINELFSLTKEESQYIKDFAFRYRTSGGVQTK